MNLNRNMRIGGVAAVAVVAVAVGGFLVGHVTQNGTTTAFTNSASSYPSATNTGVPAGIVLTAYTGPLTIAKCGTVIDSKTIDGDIDIRATNGTKSAATPCVTIKDSLIKGQVDNSYSTSTACGSSPCGPLNITDSEISNNLGTDANVKFSNYNLLRVNEHGGRTAFICDGYCTITDSYAHDNWFVNGAHMGSFLSNGNSGRPIVLAHNTLLCNIAPGSPGGSGGCSADVNFYGDFGTISNVTVTNNLLKSSNDFYYCAYTGANQPAKPNKIGTNLTWSNNVFERGASGLCGAQGGGPVADWASSISNTWCNNTWDNGGAVLGSSDNCVTPPSTNAPTTTVSTVPVTFPPPPPTTTTTAPPATTSTSSAPTTTTVPTTPTTETATVICHSPPLVCKVTS